MNIPSLSTILASITTPHPSRDWYGAVALALIVGLGLVGGAGYYFVGIQSGAIIVPARADTQPLPTISAPALNTIVAAYEARTVHYTDGTILATSAPDPAH